MNTIRSSLEMWSLDDSRCGGAEYLAEITLPALVVQPTMDTGVFPSDAAAILDALGSKDKQLIEYPAINPSAIQPERATGLRTCSQSGLAYGDPLRRARLTCPEDVPAGEVKPCGNAGEIEHH